MRQPLADRVRLAVGREQRIDDLAALDDAEVRPDLALVEDRVAGVVAALAHLAGQLFEGCRFGRSKRRNVREEGFAIGVLVDALEAHGPAVAAEVARVPGEAPRPKLRHLVAQRARVGLFVDLQRAADLQLVELFEDLLRFCRRRKRPGIERDRGWSVDRHTAAVLGTLCDVACRDAWPGPRNRRRAMNNSIRDNDVVIVAGARTPFGNLGGALADLTATDLAVAAAEAAIARSGVAKEKIDEVVFGNVIQTQCRRHLSGAPRRPASRAADRRAGADRQPALRLGPAGDSLGRAVAGAGERDLRAGRRHREHEPGAARRARRAQRFSPRTTTSRSKIRSGRRSPIRTATRRWRSPPRTWPRNTASRARSATSSRSPVKNARWRRKASGYFAEEIVPVDVPGPQRHDGTR